MFPDEDFEYRWVEVEEALAEFQELLAPNVPKLRVVRSVDVDEWERLKGVYLLYDEGDRLLYIGSTLDCFSNRAKCHARRFLAVKYTDLIVLPDKIDFMALALERFLISRLFPFHNEHGKEV